MGVAKCLQIYLDIALFVGPIQPGSGPCGQPAWSVQVGGEVLGRQVPLREDHAAAVK